MFSTNYPFAINHPCSSYIFTIVFSRPNRLLDIVIAFKPKVSKLNPHPFDSCKKRKQLIIHLMQKFPSRASNKLIKRRISFFFNSEDKTLS